MKILCIFVPLIFMSGCASLKPYENPSEGALSTLILPSKVKDYEFGLGVIKHNYTFAIADENGCGDMYEIAESETKKNVEYNIPANTNIIVNYYTSVGAMNCMVNGYFKSEIGKAYNTRGVLDSKACSIVVTTDDENGKTNLVKLAETYLDGTKLCLKK